MGSTKRPAVSMEDSDADKCAAIDGLGPKPIEESGKGEAFDGQKPSATPPKLRSMEKKKRRKELAKEKHLLALETRPQSEPKKESECPPAEPAMAVASVPSDSPGLHLSVFRDLGSSDFSLREAAVEKLVVELREVQMAYQKNDPMTGDEEAGEGVVQMEAEKDDGLEDCAPSLRYAVRRLIRGVSSSREFARQGFALGLAVVVGAIDTIKADSVMKLITDTLEITSAMKGQDARDNFLGQLFAFGSLARSGKVSAEWMSDKTSPAVKNFITGVISLANKKRYLSEPAISVILDVAEKLPDEALLTEVLGAPGVHDWFEKAAKVGNPDALFMALNLQERLSVDSQKLLPYPFSIDKFFERDHLLDLAPCFKESTFCHPRVHSLWPVVVNMLTSEAASQGDTTSCSSSTKKHKKNRKSSSSVDDAMNNLRNFCEIVIEDSLLLSSHDRKHLALKILLILFPRLPSSCIQIVLSSKVVLGLMDILSNEKSWLYNAGQHFLNEFLALISGDDHRRVAAIISFQKHSSGRFDNITKTKAVKQLVSKFHNSQGCLFFVHNLLSLFVDEGPIADENSDQSQTTDENSEIGLAEDNDPLAGANNDFLKSWVVDTMPRVLKNLKLDSDKKSLANAEIAKFIEEKFQVQTEIMKFLAVQGLFSASLGTEVTSFELQEKFKWPRTAISSSLRRVCIEQLQSLLEDAQRGQASLAINDFEINDLGSYFMRFINTVCSIPSVSLYRTLSDEDEKAFKKLLAMESRLFHEERRVMPGADANKMHALRYLLIQLLLQVILHPGEFSEAAKELVICCKKAFFVAARGDSSEEEESDENEMPELMDVLVDLLLSLLPQSSSPTCYATEQIFRVFSDKITDVGIGRMVGVLMQDLKPSRHRAIGDSDEEDEDEEDDLIGIVEAEEGDGADAAETGDSDDHVDETERKFEEGVDEELTNEDASHEMADDGEATNADVREHGGGSDSDDSDGMDDDAMFRIDPYIARVFRERKISGSDGAQSQLVPFKLRVLTLLEIYLQKNPGNTQVLKVCSFLIKAFVKSHTSDGSVQLRQRIGGILQKKIFKAKDYPRDNDILLSSLETLMEKSLKLASRSRIKAVSSVAQNSVFWVLKIISSKNYSATEMEGVVRVFQNLLVDYFGNKKSRLKLGFVREVIRRYPWLGLRLFQFLLEECTAAKSEFRRIQALDLVECIMKSGVTKSQGGEEKHVSSAYKLVKKNLSYLCELIRVLLTNLPEKQSRRGEVRRFCTRVLHTVLTLNLKKAFNKAMNPDLFSICQSQLGDAFAPFKTSDQ